MFLLLSSFQMGSKPSGAGTPTPQRSSLRHQDPFDRQSIKKNTSSFRVQLSGLVINYRIKKVSLQREY